MGRSSGILFPLTLFANRCPRPPSLSPHTHLPLLPSTSDLLSFLSFNYLNVVAERLLLALLLLNGLFASCA